MLKAYYIGNVVEAGCDEAGRGPLAGSVFAAAVVLSPTLLLEEKHLSWLEMLDDSKKLTENERLYLRPLIEQYAQTWAIAEVKPEEIENKMPVMYVEFGDKKLEELDGKTPNEYYRSFSAIELLFKT